MIINELNSNKNSKSAIVSLDYNEIRDLSNILYEITKDDEKLKRYGYLERSLSVLFDLVKHGTVDSRIVENYMESLSRERRLKEN